MILRLFLACALITASAAGAYSTNNHLNPTTAIQPALDAEAERLAELDQFWAELARTVREGDFEGYAATYHPDAVVIFGYGKKPGSMPVAKALDGWKQGFVDTKAGKKHDRVEFRFSRRLGDATTAHETGMFIFSSVDADGNVLGEYITHFEMLLVKRDGQWLGVMEYQKSEGTMADWEALQ